MNCILMTFIKQLEMMSIIEVNWLQKNISTSLSGMSDVKTKCLLVSQITGLYSTTVKFQLRKRPVCSNVLNWEAPCFCQKAPKKAPHDFFSKSATILLESATIWLFSSEHEVKKCPSWWFLFHFYVTIPSQGEIY